MTSNPSYAVSTTCSRALHPRRRTKQHHNPTTLVITKCARTHSRLPMVQMSSNNPLSAGKNSTHVHIFSFHKHKPQVVAHLSSIADVDMHHLQQKQQKQQQSKKTSLKCMHEPSPRSGQGQQLLQAHRKTLPSNKRHLAVRSTQANNFNTSNHDSLQPLATHQHGNAVLQSQTQLIVLDC